MIEIRELRINTTKLDRAERELLSGKILFDLVEQNAGVLVERAKAKAPKRTGYMANTIDHETKRIPGGAEATVGPHTDYAIFVEFGTRPHVILPVNKKALYWKGARHPVKSVHHPGTQPHPFLRPALEEQWQPFVDSITAAIKRLMGD